MKPVLAALDPPGARANERGFTLLEVAMASVITVLVLVAVLLFADTGRAHADAVQREADSARALRSAAERIGRDVRQAGASQLTVATLPDENHSVTLQHPVSMAAGALSWGVDERGLGVQPGWFVRYTVESAATGAVGTGSGRTLVRLVPDDAMQIQRREVLVRGLRAGTAEPAGFRIEPVGVMWRIELSTVAPPGKPERSVTFDLNLQN
jgi:Tfp pilus assembly protein PilW